MKSSMPRHSNSRNKSTTAEHAAAKLNTERSPSPEKAATRNKETKSEIDPATINPQQFESGRQVAAAIAKQFDLAIIGGRLLSGSGENKGASVSLRMFETTMEYLFGKPSSHPTQDETASQQVIWDIPAPARELIEGDIP